MTWKIKIRLLVLMILLALPLVACEKEGPAEKAGKALDQAFDSAKDKINDATK